MDIKLPSVVGVLLTSAIVVNVVDSLVKVAVIHFSVMNDSGGDVCVPD